MVDIYLVGVGGQGIITASKIIGDAAILAGKGVIMSETHGMAQRGGSVVCTARIGDHSSPLITDGNADVILSLELLETERAVCKSSKKTVVISSTERVVPLSVSTQKMRYPGLDEIKKKMEETSARVFMIDSGEVAKKAGVPMSSNVVMIGALVGTGVTGISREHFEKALEMNIPRRLQENLQAFAMGFDAAKR
ncbi:MAG: indolepyruvate oxidoreductase subunit beta [Candidatus Thermoplasmatota archaeon]|nr:indolepyruvate oxidoreductase subunit beta [Candidatus Thermoplasmatota archaeon]